MRRDFPVAEFAKNFGIKLSATQTAILGEFRYGKKASLMLFVNAIRFESSLRPGVV